LTTIDESGWAWFIPVNNGTTSIGFVRNKEIFDEEGKANKSTELLFDPSAVPNPSNSTMIARYISMFHLAPGMIKLITENGSMVEGSVKSASDYSYSAPKYAGPGFRVAGDAGGRHTPYSLIWKY
jgi:flavin-dependent dehydrogenase